MKKKVDKMAMGTVKIRVAVCVGATGAWAACGGDGMNDKGALDIAKDGVEEKDVINGELVFFLEAVVPVPRAQTVQARVSKLGD